MTGINNSEFARRENCDERQVRRGRESGRLVVDAQGLLDPAQVGNGWRRLRIDSRPMLGNVGTKVRAPAPVKLKRGEIVRRLDALDWTQSFDWSDEAQHARVVAAAELVGLEAVRSALVDSAHWEGYQLRCVELVKRHGEASRDAVFAGFGFELDFADVLFECREHLHHHDDSESDLQDVLIIRADLLALLACPFDEYHQPPGCAAASRGPA